MVTFEYYQKKLSNGYLLGIFCEFCNIRMQPSQAVCHRCGNKDLKIVELSRIGILRTFTIIRVASDRFEAPFAVAMVETNDSAYVIGNLLNYNLDNIDISVIGKKVEIDFKKNLNFRILYKEVFSLVFTIIK